MVRLNTIVIFLACVLLATELQVTNSLETGKVEDNTADSDLETRRIFAAWTPREKEYMFMVILVIREVANPKGNFSTCSGTLISREWVLTACHCVVDSYIEPKHVIAAAGRVNMNPYVRKRKRTPWDDPVDGKPFQVEERRARDFFCNPSFSRKNRNDGHDLALIWIEQFNGEYAAPVGITWKKMKEKKLCTVLGYGIMSNGSSAILQTVREIEAKPTSVGCDLLNTAGWICLDRYEGTRICSGDSGGPVICNGQVVGISSLSMYDTGKKPECGRSKEDFYWGVGEDKNWFIYVLTTNYSSASIMSVHAKIFLCLLAVLWMNIFMKN